MTLSIMQYEIGNWLRVTKLVIVTIKGVLPNFIVNVLNAYTLTP